MATENTEEEIEIELRSPDEKPVSQPARNYRVFTLMFQILSFPHFKHLSITPPHLAVIFTSEVFNSFSSVDKLCKYYMKHTLIIGISPTVVSL